MLETSDINSFFGIEPVHHLMPPDDPAGLLGDCGLDARSAAAGHVVTAVLMQDRLLAAIRALHGMIDLTALRFPDLTVSRHA